MFKADSALELLWLGDLSDFPTRHAAATALCVALLKATRGDPVAANRLYRLSRLFDADLDRRTPGIDRDCGHAAMAAAASIRSAALGIGRMPDSTLSTYERGTAGSFVTRLDRIKAETLAWLWPDRLPLGELVVLLGDPMSGKSSLTYSVAARVTNGRPWPDGSDNAAGDVLLLSAEDSFATTLRPRLKAEGARLKSMHVFNGMVDLSTTEGMGRLETAITNIERLRLVVVDPLTSYLPTLNTNSAAAVNRVMTALRSIAARHRIVVLVVLHIGKNSRRGAMHRALGSTAFASVPRVVYAVAADPSGDGARLLASVKFSMRPLLPSVRFRIVGSRRSPDVGVALYEDFNAPVTADELLRGAPPQREGSYERATRFLRAALAAGPCLQAEISERADGDGIALSTLRRVKGLLGIRSFHQPGDSRWWWEIQGAGGTGSSTGACSSVPLTGGPGHEAIKDRHRRK